MLELVIIDTASSATRRESLQGRTLTGGSGIDCDLVLPGEAVAARHFRIEPVDGGYRVLDLDSAAGTLVNGRSVGRATLRTGDVVEVGEYKIVVAAATGGAVPADPVHASAPASVPAAPNTAAATRRPAPRSRTPARSAGPARASAADPRTERAEAMPRRRTRTGGGGGMVVLALISVVVIIVGGYAFLKKLGGPEQRTDLDPRLAAVQQLSVECRFADADRELQALRADFASVAASLARIEKLQGEVRTRESRYERLRGELDEVDAAVAANDFDRAIDRLERLVNDASDLPRLRQNAEARMRELQDRRPEKFLDYQGLLSNAKTFADVKPRVDEMLRAGEYGKALHLATSVAVQDGEAAAQEKTVERIQEGARQAARAKFDAVAELLDSGALFPALNELDDTEILAYRGTDVWYDLLERADEIEDLIDEKVPADFRPVPRRKHARPRPGGATSRRAGSQGAESQGAQLTPDPQTEAEWGGGEANVASREAVGRAPVRATRPVTRFEQIFQEAQGLLAEQEFRLAAESFESALRVAPDSEARQRATRWMERALRPTWLAEKAVRALAERPLTSLPTLVLRTGERGQFERVDGAHLVLSVGDGERQVAGDELTPSSLLQLTGRLRLEGGDLVNRAFLALACEDERTLLALAERLDGDEDQRHAVDSLIAFHRDLDPIPAHGFTLVDGDWLTFAEREDRQVREQIQGLMATLSDDASRLDDVVSSLVELMEAYPDRVVESLHQRREQLKAAYDAIPEQERLEKLRERRAELEAARKHALELIYDEEEYFYPYHPPACPPDKARLYPAVQQEVDARVQAVRELWGREGEDYEGPGTVKLSAKTASLLDDLRSLQQLERALLGHRYVMDPSLATAYHLPAGTRTVNLRTFATSTMEREQLDRDLQVRLFNASVTLDNPSELEQVLITNDYRAMLGRQRLAFNDKLHRAARLHSEWMSRAGRLTHFEDDPNRRSPMDRMRLEGYKKGAGENCSMGTGSASQAHYGWCHSSGHHRNLLWSGHTEMASGQAGSWWTQNFGGGSEYRGNLIGQ